MVVPCGSTSVSSVDARKDDHGYGGDAFAEDGQCLVSAMPRASLAMLFAVVGAPTRTSLLGWGLGSCGSLGVDLTGRPVNDFSCSISPR